MSSFDPDKDAINKAKHGLSLADAELIDWGAALVWEDDRKEYGETRLVALAPMTTGCSAVSTLSVTARSESSACEKQTNVR